MSPTVKDTLKDINAFIFLNFNSWLISKNQDHFQVNGILKRERSLCGAILFAKNRPKCILWKNNWYYEAKLLGKDGAEL